MELTYIIWKPQVDLTRPRTRLQRPAVYFTASLSISAEAMSATQRDGKIYLKSLEPLSVNVLEPLQSSPSLSETTAYLSEMRITKVAPTTSRPQDGIKPVRGASKRAFPIVPALFTRVRYTSISDAITASLHLETSQVITGVVAIKTIQLESPETDIKPLNSVVCPLETQGGDETVLLYRLAKSTSSTNHGPSSVAVHIEATVQQDEAEIPINLHWKTQVDLSQTNAKPTYKWSRPLSASTIRPPARPSIHGDSKAGPLELARAVEVDEIGVTFNIWTRSIIPSRIDFKLFIQCINRSERPRRFAIVVVEPKKRSMQIQASSQSGKPDVITDTFDAPTQTQRPPHVFDLNPDVRIGPVPPGASYETELKFWATTTGVLDLGILRIVDLDTRQTVDVRDLPDVVVLDPKAG